MSAWQRRSLAGGSRRLPLEPKQIVVAAPQKIDIASALQVASAIELAILSGSCGVAALMGRFSPWLDVVNAFDPFFFILGLAALALSLVVFRGEAFDQWVVTVALIGTLAPAAMMLPDFAHAFVGSLSHMEPTAKPLRVLTLNAWMDNRSPALTVDRILRADPDILLIQEGGGLWSERPRLRVAYPFQVIGCALPARCGLLILSNHLRLGTRCRLATLVVCLP